MEVIGVLIHEVCKQCGLTKKAVEYYIEQGLVAPATLENGYRRFSQSDAERLQRIAVLRALGLAVADIAIVLEDPGTDALARVSQETDMEILELREKQRLIEKLAQDNDWDSAAAQLKTLEQKQTITRRLLGLFPGYYGKYVSLHFARFLGEPIQTPRQEAAFETIIDYLDGAILVIPEDLKDFLDEAARNISKINMDNLYKNFAEAIRDPKQYMADRKEILEMYMAYKKSDEYKESSDYRLKEVLTQFQVQSGYNDVFIPAMKELSESYKKYHDGLMKANALFIEAYGDALEG
jgi:DNA-binding transcriptional MerR regulator